MLEDCYNCLCKNGLENTSMRQLAEACGTTTGNFYSNYFKNRDEIIIEATEYCMSKVEQDFMMYAPKTIDEVEKYLREMPKITAKLHGEKYRIMY
ncbi:MAG: TetR family transcriptional regulator [Clostridiales bacterium]|nr:TetR family transcriptional regulator [Clostridiales bacterium]